MGDGAEGSSATGHGRQAAISFTPDVDGMHAHIFESLQFVGSYVEDLLYIQTRLSIYWAFSPSPNFPVVYSSSSLTFCLSSK